MAIRRTDSDHRKQGLRPQLFDARVCGEPSRRSDLRSLTGALVEFNSDTWRAKKEAGISLNAPISDVSVPDSLAALTSSLAAMHKLEQL